MVARFELPQMSPQGFLAWEAEQPGRYEYVDGIAMAGGTIPHNQIM
jgi:hypothetical protein